MPAPSSLQRPMLLGTIHCATVTAAGLHYVGSIAVDADLLDAADDVRYRVEPSGVPFADVRVEAAPGPR